tara:strand:- start:4928 stop:5107 length:180 start_codon:yes stop_codon:yes gene_type:complete
MIYTLKDLYTNKVLGTYGTKAAAEKALSNSVQEPGESRYEIVSPKKSKPKAVDVEEESD